MLDQVTIVIPTHNRHHLLEKRALPHFLEFGVHLLVIDSTKEPHKASLENPNIDYVHCPNEPLPHKMKRPVLDRVKTPYMVMNADDTLTSKQGIIDCIGYLEKNPDYSSATGMYLACYSHDKSRIRSWCPSEFFMHADSDRPQERPMQHFVRFFSLFYAVQRTDNWFNIFRSLPENIVNYYLNETYVVMMTLMHGKCAKLPIFFAATESGPSINDRDARYFCSPYKLGIKKRYQAEVASTKAILVQYMMKFAQLSEEVSSMYVEAALSVYWYQELKVKSLGDRLNAEWVNLLNKTLYKKKNNEIKAQKRAAALQKEQDCVAQVLELMGESGREEFERLIKVIQRTHM